MTTNFRQAARILGYELKEKGYGTRLDDKHAHPRLYIVSGDKEMFTILSSTASYDSAGNLMKIKRRDIEGLLTKLPTPVLKVTNGKGESPNTPESNDVTIDARVYPIKVFLRGAREKPSLVIQVPTEAIPDGKRHIEVFLTIQEPQCLGLIFKITGAEPSKTVSEKLVAYTFTKDTCPFKYADNIPPKGYKAPYLFARFRGDALVCDQPVPNEIMTGELPVKEKPKSEYNLTDGAELLTMINDWIEWAEALGHEPNLSITNNVLEIEIAEKVTRKL